MSDAVVAPALPAPSALRGSPERLTNFMEAFQVGHIRSIAAAAGAVVVPPPEIDEGIDLFLTHRSASHAIEAARVEVQLKATTRTHAEGDTGMTIKLKRSRYDYLRTADPIVPKLLIVMTVPTEQADWLQMTEKRTRVRRAAYWVNLEGMPAVATKTVTVTVPRDQIFDDLALCEIMARVGQGVRP